MLTALFALAAIVLIASFIRPPRAFWQRAIVALAGILMLAVLIAWGIEFMMQSEDANARGLTATATATA